VAGALLVPNALATIMEVFPEDERGAAIGSWTAWGAIAGVVGPVAGGALIDAASWRLIFAINLPIVVGTLVLIARGVPVRVDHPRGGRVDAVGALLGAAALAGPVFALTEQPVYGWADTRIVVPLTAGVVAALLFIWHERRTPDPMLPLALFRSRNFAVGNVATLTIYAGLGGMTFLLPLFLQQTAGYSATDAGLSLLPLTVIIFLLSKRFGAFSDRVGPRLLMGAGPLVAAAGVLLFLRLDRSGDYVSEILPGVILFGLGLAMTVAPLTATVLGAVEEEHAGIASGVNNAIARVAGLLAIAALGAVVSAQFTARLDQRLPTRALDARARFVVERAKSQPLGGVSLDGLSGRERREVARALDDASERGFHFSIAIAGLLVALGGAISAGGIRNPKRLVVAEKCPGGALHGASRDLGSEALRGRVPAPAAGAAR
jgi:MFS family permease